MVGISELTSQKMTYSNVTTPPEWRAWSITADRLRFVSSWYLRWLRMSTKVQHPSLELEQMHTENKPMKTLLTLFVEENKDRDDIVGDLCWDLSHDDLFYSKKTETEQIAYIKGLPTLHGSHLDDSVKEFFRVFKEHSREL